MLAGPSEVISHEALWHDVHVLEVDPTHVFPTEYKVVRVEIRWPKYSSILFKVDSLRISCLSENLFFRKNAGLRHTNELLNHTSLT
jgi:hypothetical protein